MHDRRRLDAAWLTLPLFLALLSAPAAHAGDAGGAALELIADGLNEPSNLASPLDGRERIYVIDYQVGEIRVIEDGRLLPQAFLDLSDRLVPDPNFEEGVLSLALSPQFPQTPYVYVTFIDVEGDLVLSRFEVLPSGLEAAAASEKVLLKLGRDARQHHCGHIEFGPRDGLLYLCVGDTQTNQTVEPVSQDPDEPRGKLLRLNVEPDVVAGMEPVAETTAPDDYEIWMTGLRNPWRFGFDAATGDLYIPDLGRRAWEEIDFLPAPIEANGNFGWPTAEGNDCVRQCDRPDLIWPIYEYPHIGNRCAVIGGAVYHGATFPEWDGVYIFGDQCSGEIWALRHPDGTPEVRKLAETDLMPSAVGTRFDGEILITDMIGGAVWKLVLPNIEGGWTSAEEAMYAMNIEARRARVGWTEERIRQIEASRAWTILQSLEPLRSVYHRLRKLF